MLLMVESMSLTMLTQLMAQQTITQLAAIDDTLEGVATFNRMLAEVMQAAIQAEYSDPGEVVAVIADFVTVMGSELLGQIANARDGLPTE